MIVIGIILSIFGIGFLCWVLFTLAVYALPFFAAVSAGMYAYETGAGPIGVIAVGLIAGALTLVIGQLTFAAVRSTWIRVVVALLFAAPAALAGYHATLGLTRLTMPSESWQMAFSVIGAVVVGITALARIAAIQPAYPTQAVSGSTPPPVSNSRA